MTPLLRAARNDPVASADPNNVLRSRMAPFVLALGGSAILVLTLTLIIVLAIMTSSNAVLQGKIDSLLLGIFGSVLPILATWVGTVIAFYFTNESYRQAAEATAAATAGLRPSGPRVTERMIPFDKIAKISVERKDARTEWQIEALMNEPVTRVVIFDKAGCPVFVIRRRLYPLRLDRRRTVYRRSRGGRCRAIPRATAGRTRPTRRSSASSRPPQRSRRRGR